MTISERLAAAHVAAADLTPVGGVSALVGGIGCLHIPLPHPWSTQGRALVDLPTPGELAAATGWLGGHSPQWTLMTRGTWVRDRVFTDFHPWLTLPAYSLDTRRYLDGVTGPAGLEIGPAAEATEFLSAYGKDLAPLVTARHLAAPGFHYLVGRLDGRAVGCARVQRVAGTAYVSAVTVRPAYRRQGIGAALSAAASRLGTELADLVWLHAAEHARRLYERLGYSFQTDHVVLIHPEIESAEA